MKKRFTLSKSKGFTLIELLVVIAIVGLLASIVMVGLNSARSKSRDTKRIAELKQMMSALELYYSDNGHYPAINYAYTSSAADGCGYIAAAGANWKQPCRLI